MRVPGWLSRAGLGTRPYPAGDRGQSPRQVWFTGTVMEDAMKSKKVTPTKRPAPALPTPPIEHGPREAFYNNLPTQHPMIVCLCGSQFECGDTWEDVGAAFDEHLRSSEGTREFVEKQEQKQEQKATQCTYPTGCTKKRLPGLTMCKKHQPYPARSS